MVKKAAYYFGALLLVISAILFIILLLAFLDMFSIHEKTKWGIRAVEYFCFAVGFSITNKLKREEKRKETGEMGG